MSLWLIPMIYAAASFLGGITLPRLEQAYFPYDSGISVASAQAFLTAVASGMIALTGIVFTVSLVMVQFSAIAYSPRLVLLLARDPKLFHSLGVFIATFTYSLCVLLYVDRNGSGVVPLISGVAVAGLLLLSMLLFSALMKGLRDLQITFVLHVIGTLAARSYARRFSASMRRQKINRSADKRRAMFLNWVRLSKR